MRTKNAADCTACYPAVVETLAHIPGGPYIIDDALLLLVAARHAGKCQLLTQFAGLGCCLVGVGNERKFGSGVTPMKTLLVRSVNVLLL